MKTLPDFPGKERLTPTELIVADYLVHGFSAKEIATEMRISARTLELHAQHIRRKLLPNMRGGTHMGVTLTRLVYGLDAAEGS